MMKIQAIGNVEKTGNEYFVQIDRKFKKGLKCLDYFSHVHLLCITSEQRFTFVTGKMEDLNVRDCEIKVHVSGNERILEDNCTLTLVDIKPYLPSEDNAETTESNGENREIRVEKNEENAFELNYQGEIRNNRGVYYLQYNDVDKMPRAFNEYIHVLWWFDKFDEPKYRRVLQCETPYESQGHTGVFACRAPIRPNPIAITAVKINGVDYENGRVYINEIESFDHTPFLGVIDYCAQTDKVQKCDLQLPPWAKEWPDEIIIKDKAAMEKSVQNVIEELDANTYIIELTNQEEEKGNTAEREGKIINNEKPTHIVVRGARENNLKGLSVSIPYGKITAVVGVSGSGKSSLVMDTVYAECRRRMEQLNGENLSRQRPEMDSMTGCIPVVMISQKEIRTSSNSTIGTFSGINHHLRSIYAAIGKRHFMNKNVIQFKLTPTTFSFLDPECRCDACNGKGVRFVPDMKKIITNPNISLLDGASPFLGKLKTFVENPNANWMKGQVVALAESCGVDLSKPWNELPESFQNDILYGDENKQITFSFDNKKTGRKGEISRKLEGIMPIINRLYIEDDKGGMASKFMSEYSCDVCKGERLAAEGRLVTVLGIRFPVAAAMTFSSVKQFALYMKKSLPEEDKQLVKEHIDAVILLCDTAKRLGIEYLEMSRGVSMISGGEARRLKLLSAFQNHMAGMLYIFDEPSKKLSSKEYNYIIEMMRELIKEGNTVLMVEHNMDMINIADYVIEIGPKAGKNGGYLMTEGALSDVIIHKNSLLGKYAGNYNVFNMKKIREDFSSWVQIENVTANNLVNFSVSFPKKAMTCITGVSGSGKSTLLYKGILQQTEKSSDFDSVILVESRISGGTSRSVVATYVGIMDDIRTLFAATEDAVELGYSDKDFSFNTGRLKCEHCSGDGRVKIPFTEDSYGVCPVCQGKRYTKAINNVLFQNRTIAEVLEMSAYEAKDFFGEYCPSIAEKCSFLIRVGLSYILLGQSTSMLSGGEAARLKIASCLMKANMKNSLFLLDEPTCGLHFSDVDNLILLLEEIIDLGNTVVVIEHNKRFLSAADYTITLEKK